MTDIENYHDWLRDAHAMEKQAESMLESMVKRIDSYPELCTRLEQHLFETRRQITVLDDIIARNNISRSVLKDSMSKIAAMGQSIGGMFPQDEVVKGVISGYVFEQFEVACYTSLLTAAQKVNDHDSIADLESILAEEHLFETRRQITVLDDIIARNNISRSVLKDSMSKIAAMGQSIGGMFPQDEVVKGVISGYVFEQFEVACYTSLLTAAQKVNDHDSIAELESILAEERGMAEWLLQHIPDITEQYIIRSETPGFDAKR